MKNIILSAALFIFAVSAATAQTTQTNTSVTLNTIGMGVNYEQAWGQRGSIVARAGLVVPAIGRDYWGDAVWAVSPEIGLEARLYYNLDNRIRKGKSADLNSGDYFSLDCRYIFPTVAGSKHHAWDGSHYKYDVRGLLISPNWGMRRVYGGHWLLEFSPGLNFFIQTDHVTVTPRTNFKFGFVF